MGSFGKYDNGMEPEYKVDPFESSVMNILVAQQNRLDNHLEFLRLILSNLQTLSTRLLGEEYKYGESPKEANIERGKGLCNDILRKLDGIGCASCAMSDYLQMINQELNTLSSHLFADQPNKEAA